MIRSILHCLKLALLLYWRPICPPFVPILLILRLKVLSQVLVRMITSSKHIVLLYHLPFLVRLRRACTIEREGELLRLHQWVKGSPDLDMGKSTFLIGWCSKSFESMFTCRKVEIGAA